MVQNGQLKEKLPKIKAQFIDGVKREKKKYVKREILDKLCCGKRKIFDDENSAIKEKLLTLLSEF